MLYCLQIVLKSKMSIANHICLAIRQGSLFRTTQGLNQPSLFCYKSFQNNQKNLDPSLKDGSTFLGLFWNRKSSCLITE